MGTQRWAWCPVLSIQKEGSSCALLSPAGPPAHLPPCPGITGAASVPLCSLAFLPVPQDVMLDVMLAHPVDDIKLIEPRGQDAAGAFGTLGEI